MHLYIVGQGRHGKDTLAELLQEFIPEISFTSSSLFLSEKVVFPLMKDQYANALECFEDRHTGDNRAFWYNAICDYTKDDPTRASDELFAEHDIYIGIRNIKELNAMRDKYDDVVVIWVDAEQRIGSTEDSSSNTIRKEDADIVVYNNESLEDFRRKAKILATLLKEQLLNGK